MSTRTVTYLTDDLTGEEGDDVETVLIGWKGKWAEVDLAKDNREDAEDYIGKLMSAGRAVKAPAGGSGKTRQASGGGAKYNRETSAQIREWARGEGYELSDRGRIPGQVVEAWENAHQAA